MHLEESILQNIICIIVVNDKPANMMVQTFLVPHHERPEALLVRGGFSEQV
jgi:hypothetical protein